MDESKEKSLCLQFYNYLCEKIGTRELVRLRQKFYLLFDFLQKSKKQVVINSGSKSEGLDLEGSDIDIMILLRNITVLENENDAQCKMNEPNVFIMYTEDIKPGFTMLKLSKTSFIPNGSKIVNCCDIWGNDIVLSNWKAKQWLSFGVGNATFIHGPCISDEGCTSDLALCVRCPTWIGQARKLRGIGRFWPCPSVIENIEKCGILFVPIGGKTSATGEFEWRISFSIAEKLLIYTFSHTQILCYALLKIMLKEIIDKYPNSKGILCSYFLKTVVFWVSEEYHGDEWQPEMIIQCFMACLARLVYCVDHSYLPHYFIPEINLLEDKLVLKNATELRHLLNEFYRKGPQFLKYSKTLSKSAVLNLSSLYIINIFNALYRYDKLCISGAPNIGFCCQNCCDYLQSKIAELSFKRCNPLNLNVFIFRTCQLAGNSRGHTRFKLLPNKYFYKIHKQRLPYIILGLNADSAAGWLYLATYFFTLNHFSVSLRIVDYALSKCTPDKVYCKSESLQYEQLDSTEQQALKYDYLDISSIYKRHVVKSVRFKEGFIHPFDITDELKNRHMFTNSSLPPVVYAHYLRFLCFYRLNDRANCRESLQDIQLTIENEYFLCDHQKVNSYKLLSIAHLKIGDRNAANNCLAFANLLENIHSCFKTCGLQNTIISQQKRS